MGTEKAHNFQFAPKKEQHRRFCEVVALSANPDIGHAYAEAYGKQDFTEKKLTYQKSASRLLKKDEISNYIKELQEFQRRELADKENMTKAEKLRLLTDMARDDKATMRQRVAAIAEHNKMTGDLAPAETKDVSDIPGVIRLPFKVDVGAPVDLPTPDVGQDKSQEKMINEKPPVFNSTYGVHG